MRNLPEPDTLYLAHIHPGTCAEGEEEEGHEHEADTVSFPLLRDTEPLAARREFRIIVH